jgi:hypothetical protein
MGSCLFFFWREKKGKHQTILGALEKRQGLRSTSWDVRWLEGALKEKEDKARKHTI